MKKLLIVIGVVLLVIVGLYLVWQVLKLIAYFAMVAIVGFVAGWLSRKYYKE